MELLSPSGGRGKRGLLIGAGTALAVMLLGAAVALAWPGDQEPVASKSPEAGVTPSAGEDTSPSPKASPQVPQDEQCTTAIKANKRWVCLTKAVFDGEKITITYQANFDGATPRVNGGYHLHIYGGDGTEPAEETMGTHASSPGAWYVEDQEESVRSASSRDFAKAIGDAPKVCARIADSRHRLVPDDDGGYHTGNCVPIERA